MLGALLRASAGEEKTQTNCEEFNGSSTWSALSKASAESDGRRTDGRVRRALVDGCFTGL